MKKRKQAAEGNSLIIILYIKYYQCSLVLVPIYHLRGETNLIGNTWQHRQQQYRKTAIDDMLHSVHCDRRFTSRLPHEKKGLAYMHDSLSTASELTHQGVYYYLCCVYKDITVCTRSLACLFFLRMKTIQS